MGRAGVLQETRRMRFEALLDRHERGELARSRRRNTIFDEGDRGIFNLLEWEARRGRLPPRNLRRRGIRDVRLGQRAGAERSAQTVICKGMELIGRFE
jgi:hypothetical protein